MWRASVLHGPMLDSHGVRTVRSQDAPLVGSLQQGRIERGAGALPNGLVLAVLRKVRAPMPTVRKGHAQASLPTGPVLRPRRTPLASVSKRQAPALVALEQRTPPAAVQQ
jgi:hypothetical protein